jgi:hypothetical protein
MVRSRIRLAAGEEVSWLRNAVSRGQSRGQCDAKLPLTLDMTGWYSSHDRCLRPVPYLAFPPARRARPCEHACDARRGKAIGQPSQRATWHSSQQQNVRQNFPSLPSTCSVSFRQSTGALCGDPAPSSILGSPGARPHDRKRLTDGRCAHVPI